MAKVMRGFFDLPGRTPAQWSLEAYKETLMQLTTVMRVFSMTKEANEAWDRISDALDNMGEADDDDAVDNQLSRLYALHNQAWEATQAAAKGCSNE